MTVGDGGGKHDSNVLKVSTQLTFPTKREGSLSRCMHTIVFPSVEVARRQGGGEDGILGTDIVLRGIHTTAAIYRRFIKHACI